MALPPQQFEQAVRDWMRHCVGVPDAEGELEAVAMDGKTLCGTLQPHERAVHLLSLLDHKTGCTLSQTRVADSTNEAKAAHELLKSLVLRGRIVTGDAMFCQRDLCQQILQANGHIQKVNDPGQVGSAVRTIYPSHDVPNSGPYSRRYEVVAPATRADGRIVPERPSGRGAWKRSLAPVACPALLTI